MTTPLVTCRKALGCEWGGGDSDSSGLIPVYIIFNRDTRAIQ